MRISVRFRRNTHAATCTFDGVVETTNEAIVRVIREKGRVTSFSIRHEVMNVSLNAPEWSHGKLAVAAPSDTIKYRICLIHTGNHEAKDVRIRLFLPPCRWSSENVKNLIHSKCRTPGQIA